MFSPLPVIKGFFLTFSFARPKCRKSFSITEKALRSYRNVCYAGYQTTFWRVKNKDEKTKACWQNTFLGLVHSPHKLTALQVVRPLLPFPSPAVWSPVESIFASVLIILAFQNVHRTWFCCLRCFNRVNIMWHEYKETGKHSCQFECFSWNIRSIPWIKLRKNEKMKNPSVNSQKLSVASSFEFKIENKLWTRK